MKAKSHLLAVVVLGLVVAHSVGFAGAPTIQNTQSTAFNAAIATSTNGELGLFLIGTWDNRFYVDESVSTLVHLVNPVSTNKWAFVTFWSASEVPLYCQAEHLTPNGVAEVSTTGGIYHSGTDTTYYFGAVKVLVTNESGYPDLGLVGYRKEIHPVTSNVTTSIGTFTVYAPTQSEIRLQPVPPKVVFSDRTPQDGTPDEVKAIRDLCQPD